LAVLKATLLAGVRTLVAITLASAFSLSTALSPSSRAVAFTTFVHRQYLNRAHKTLTG
jgi:hypothetical protein